MRCLNLFKRKKPIRKGPLVLTDPTIDKPFKLGAGTLSINDISLGFVDCLYIDKSGHSLGDNYTDKPITHRYLVDRETPTPSQLRKMEKRYHTGGGLKPDERPAILQGGGVYLPADFAFPLFDAADTAVTTPVQLNEPSYEPVHNSHEPSVGIYSGSDLGSSSHDTGYSSSYSGSSDYGSSSSYDSGSSGSFDSSGSW